MMNREHCADPSTKRSQWIRYADYCLLHVWRPTLRPVSLTGTAFFVLLSVGTALLLKYSLISVFDII